MYWKNCVFKQSLQKYRLFEPSSLVAKSQEAMAHTETKPNHLKHPQHRTPMEGEKIVLDKDAFRALAVDTRVRILKQLSERPHTLTELAETLELSPATLSEHLTLLESANLVTKHDEGRKWKYYTLTLKGKSIFKPTEVRVFFSFMISAIATLTTATIIIARWLIGLDSPTDAPAEAIRILEQEPLIEAEHAAEAAAYDPLTILFLILVFLTAALLVAYVRTKRTNIFKPDQ